MTEDFLAVLFAADLWVGFKSTFSSRYLTVFFPSADLDRDNWVLMRDLEADLLSVEILANTTGLGFQIFSARNIFSFWFICRSHSCCEIWFVLILL